MISTECTQMLPRTPLLIVLGMNVMMVAMKMVQRPGLVRCNIKRRKGNQSIGPW